MPHYVVVNSPHETSSFSPSSFSKVCILLARVSMLTASSFHLSSSSPASSSLVVVLLVVVLRADPSLYINGLRFY